MANLTIAVNDEALKKARLKALEQGTSVNALLRDFLESYAGVHNGRRQAAQKLLDLSDRLECRSGAQPWSRDELHERDP
ncbi:MAG: hypothetical protein GXY54_03035 [Deltaproteobacteria bacterium]|nr:hypothetical protein [Deltaproteobacteria bacterium]